MLVFTKEMEEVSKERHPLLGIQIIGSGSSGNSVYFKRLRLLIDIGFPFKKYPENFFNHVDAILITHEHIDHINLSTLKKIMEQYPNCKIILSNHTYEGIIKKKKTEQIKENKSRLDIIDLSNPPYKKEIILQGREKKLKTTIQINTALHGDLIVSVYDIYNKALGLRILYGTDLESLKAKSEGVSGLEQNKTVKYNIMMLESNYNKEKLLHLIFDMQQSLRKMEDEKDIKETSNLIFRAKSNYRHLSEEESFMYMKEHLTEKGVYIPLHASSMFGTYIQESNI